MGGASHRTSAAKEGVVVVDKPAGITSHDVVSRVRRIFDMRRVGHAGTLDPLATGVLVILLGKKTKLFQKFESFDKAYKAKILLGCRTTTADIEGEEIERRSCDHVSEGQVRQALEPFVGEIEQVPPMVSAVKFKGKRLYELARKGLDVERRPRRVTIHHLVLTDFALPYIEIFLECSKGTYVRQIAEDVGQRLQCGACITEIKRTRVGPFTIEESVSLADLNESHIRQWTA